MAFPYKTVLLTGASSGLGAEMARQLGRQGCKLALVARRAELLEHLAAEINAAGGTALPIACDVADVDAAARAVARAESELGALDCVIANAGIGQPLTPRTFDPRATEQIFRVNMLGMTNVFYAALPAMLQRKRGHLVGVASLASYQGLPSDGGYAASKAAMRTHCEGLRIELRGTGIHVTTICPGFVRTPMTDKNQFNMAFLLEAEPAARRMLRAIARKRRVYNFPRRLWWLVRFGMMTPRWLFDAAVGSQTGKMGGRTQALSDGSPPKGGTHE